MKHVFRNIRYKMKKHKLKIEHRLSPVTSKIHKTMYTYGLIEAPEVRITADPQLPSAQAAGVQ